MESISLIASVLPAEQHARFMQSVLAESDDCIKIIGLDGTLQFMSEGGQRVMEVDDFATIRGCPWPDFWQGQGNASAIAALEAARSGESARFEGVANTAKGNRRYWDVKVSPILREDGSVESILSVSRDITAVKDAEAQQALLRNELAHRIKNLIGLVQAIANQSMREDDDMSVAKPTFLARLTALGAAHDLLTHKSHARTTLHDVAQAVVAQNEAGRIDLSGPPVELSSRSALALALALHELATNAVKYGALSNDVGTVKLEWDMIAEGDAQKLSLRWTEIGGPEVVPPRRRGFGSRMIARALASYVHGTANLDYRPEGVAFTLEASVEALTAE